MHDRRRALRQPWICARQHAIGTHRAAVLRLWPAPRISLQAPCRHEGVVETRCAQGQPKTSPHPSYGPSGADQLRALPLVSARGLPARLTAPTSGSEEFG